MLFGRSLLRLGTVLAQSRRQLSMKSREIICADTNEWIKTVPLTGFGEKTCVFTSLPDISELPNIYRGYLVDDYKQWFTDTVYEIMSRLNIGNYIVLLQSDVRMMNNSGDTYEWIDKSHLASVAADRSNCTLMWHKLVLTSKDMNKRSTGRPSYSHLVCYVKNAPLDPSPLSSSFGKILTIEEATKHRITHRTSHFAIPDIFYRGEMLWTKGLGLDCCYAGVMFLKEVGQADCILDPFCGYGTILAMANAVGVNAKGVEISPSRCKKSQKLTITEEQLGLVSGYIRNMKLNVVDERKERHQLEEESSDIYHPEYLNDLPTGSNKDEIDEAK
eukprot:gene12839-14067_t